MKMVALLRGINVGGNRKVPMAKCIGLTEHSGFTEVQSYINSGNIVFKTHQTKTSYVREKLEQAIGNAFEFHVDVSVRTTAHWESYAKSSPFPNAQSIQVKMLHLGIAKIPLKRDLAQGLAEKASHSEKIKIVDGAIWVDFADDVGRSNLTPAFFDKTAGAPFRMRN